MCAFIYDIQFPKCLVSDQGNKPGIGSGHRAEILWICSEHAQDVSFVDGKPMRRRHDAGCFTAEETSFQRSSAAAGHKGTSRLSWAGPWVWLQSPQRWLRLTCAAAQAPRKGCSLQLSRHCADIGSSEPPLADSSWTQTAHTDAEGMSYRVLWEHTLRCAQNW